MDRVPTACGVTSTATAAAATATGCAVTRSTYNYMTSRSATNTMVTIAATTATSTSTSTASTTSTTSTTNYTTPASTGASLQACFAAVAFPPTPATRLSPKGTLTIWFTSRLIHGQATRLLLLRQRTHFEARVRLRPPFIVPRW
jgi:hypothetical protein